ncbi:MAG: hypothetical protein LBH84_03270 [Prevotellaceae bacterium]|jgi:hypothetical protein|nr:hypothetical protein [Prevotellaceae bacterium]
MGSEMHPATYFVGALLLLASCAGHRVERHASLEENFRNPPGEAKPWACWRWTDAASSLAGITSDLEAMQQAGVGGAYLIPAQEAEQPSAELLLPKRWEMVRHAMREADRLGLKIALHGCDGLAADGETWVTPELSMQRIVWTKKTVAGRQGFCDTLPQPQSRCGYYRDIAVYAFPASDSACVPLSKIVDLTGRFRSGRLTWNVPAGRWIILRMGHTSTGHTTSTGGLEYDKLSRKAVRIYFDRWVDELIRQVGTELSGRVLKGVHVDSREYGSLSWSPDLRKEFKRRRGYDLLPYLPIVSGLSVESADLSERFLLDFRQTIVDMVADNFYGVLQKGVHKFGCTFSAECAALATVGSGMAHYRYVDIPTSELCPSSAAYDKSGGLLNAVSGAHIYGKNIVQAKIVTPLSSARGEHPVTLKTISDYAYAAGINRLTYRAPADGQQDTAPDGEANLFLQRGRAWWKPGRAWVEYAQRCQTLLQHGRPVADVAVFAGEETSAWAAIPERLVTTLPGIVGREVVEREVQRLADVGVPVHEDFADGFGSAKPEKYVNLLRGYKYDLLNRDALLRLARVENGRIVLQSGASYALLALPHSTPLAPTSGRMSAKVAARLLSLIKAGATVLVGETPMQAAGLDEAGESDLVVRRIAAQIWGGAFAEEFDEALGRIYTKNLGRGRVVKLPYYADSFLQLGLERDVDVSENGQHAAQMAWTHRTSDSVDIYFISNQTDRKRTLTLALRTTGASPELWDAVSGVIITNVDGEQENSHTTLQICLPERGSVFVVFRKTAGAKAGASQHNIFSPSFAPKPLFSLDGAWLASPCEGQAGEDGTTCYTQTFTWSAPGEQLDQLWLDLGWLTNPVRVTLNGHPCGVAWTPPYRVDITGALREGSNTLSVEVAGAWADVPPPDSLLSPQQEAGLPGEVKIVGGESE